MDVWGEYVQLTLESTGYNEMIYLGAAFGVVFGLYLAIRVFHAEAPKIAARPTWPVLLELPLMLNDFVMLFILGFTLGFVATYLLAVRLLKWFDLHRARVTDGSCATTVWPTPREVRESQRTG